MKFETINEIIMERVYTLMSECGVEELDWEESYEEFWLEEAKKYIKNKEKGYEILMAEFPDLA